MQKFLNSIDLFLTGPVMVWGVLIVGAVLTYQTGFIQFRKLGFMLKYTFSQMFKKQDKSKSGITPFQAVTTALSGTIGTGNIAGVATAITIGGAGALFWMWVSAFFSMATKYSEIVLAMKYRKQDSNGMYLGGPMYYMKKAFKGNIVASLFSVICIIASFGIGNMVQSNTAALAIKQIFIAKGLTKINVSLIMIVVAVLIGFVIVGGIKRIAKTTESLVPAMAMFYIIACVIIIFMNIPAFLKAFVEIITSAFQIKSAVGGACGFTMIRAMKIGFARGVFTNEAGLGSAPIAHAAADNKLPCLQGIWGIFEVFFDTIIMCSLTGFVIVISGLHHSDLDGAALTLNAFEKYLGNFASIVIAISTVFFAVSTIIGWSYYGETCVKYLFKSKIAVLIYKLIFIAAIYFGSITTIEFVWGLSDVVNAMMMIPNLIAVVLLSNEVKKETNKLDNINNKNTRKTNLKKI